MPSTMAYRQGDIVVSFPFRGSRAGGGDLTPRAEITDDPHAVHLWRGGRARSARAGLKTPKQKNPARVLLTDAEYEALLKAALLMDWRFRVALVIAHETGHRIGAIRQLCWSDIDMEGRTIRWRAEHEKTGHEHRTPVTAEALDAPTPNVPARTRTWGLLLRRQSLYPPELRGLDVIKCLYWLTWLSREACCLPEVLVLTQLCPQRTVRDESRRLR